MILDAIFTEDNHILDADFGLVVPIGNREEIYNAGKLATLKESQYMNGKESGTIISVNDVTPIEHNVGVKVASKNLFDMATAWIEGKNINITNDGNKIDYAALNDSNSKRIQMLLPINLFNLGEQYTFKMNATTQPSNIYVGNANSQSDTSSYKIFGTASSTDLVKGQVFFTVNNLDKPYVCIFLYFATMVVGDTGTMTDLQIELGTTATEYTPYVADLTEVEVARYGANIFDSQTYYKNPTDYKLKVKGGVMLYRNGQVGVPSLWQIIDVNDNLIGTFQDLGFTSSNPILLPQDAYYIISTDTRPQMSSLIISYSPITNYEPYIEPQIYTANADGTVEGVKSISPNMTLIPNNNGVTLECEYLRDIDLYIDNLITNVALTGGN